MNPGVIQIILRQYSYCSTFIVLYEFISNVEIHVIKINIKYIWQMFISEYSTVMV